MAYLSYGLNQGEGFIIVTGDIGTGKTTLVRHLFDTLDRNEFIAAMIVSTQLSAEDLLRSVVAAFGLDAQADDKGQLLSRLERFLREQYAMGRRALLVVDEAQNLSNAALEEMRMLSNFQEGDKALIQSFLVGQPEFRERIFVAPELEQLRQRVIATHHLEPMEQEELAYYIEHRLSLVGWDNDPCFTADAVEEIFNQCQGVPRRLNTLCSRVLLYGSLEEIHEIDAQVIRDVVSDMAVDQRPVTATSSALPSHIQPQPQPHVPAQTPVNRQNDATIPLEANASKEVEKMEGRMDKLENMMKSQDETLQKLTSIMAQLASGGSKGDEG